MPRHHDLEDDLSPAERYDDLEDMRGILFKNLKKEKPTHSDHYGLMRVGGKRYWMNGWVHIDKNGNPYLALRFKPKDDDFL
jgi:hypothetical protein